MQGGFLGRQLIAEKAHACSNHISPSLEHLPTSPALLLGQQRPWLPSASPCRLQQSSRATFQPSSHLLCLQHLVSLCIPDALVLAQGALPDPLLALDADGGPRGSLSVRGGQLRSGGPCKQKAPQLHWEAPAAREDCHRARTGKRSCSAPWGWPPLRDMSSLCGKGDSVPQQ